MIQCSSGVVQAYGAAANAFQFPLIDLPTDKGKIEIVAGNSFFFGSSLTNAGTVDGTHKNLLIAESSTSNPATYKIVLIGKV